MAIFKASSKPGKLKPSIIYADKDKRRENNYKLSIEDTVIKTSYEKSINE